MVAKRVTICPTFKLNLHRIMKKEVHVSRTSMCTALALGKVDFYLQTPPHLSPPPLPSPYICYHFTENPPGRSLRESPSICLWRKEYSNALSTADTLTMKCNSLSLLEDTICVPLF